MSDLKVSTIQSELQWEDKEQNLKMFQNLIESISETTDLIVLPEMFNTGFSMNAKELADKMDGETIQWMKKMARSKSAAITGSIIIEENGNYYNRLIFVDELGNVHTYDKRHLFGMGDENNHYTAGTDKLIIDYKGWKLNLNVCYDLRFPVWLRNDKNNPYDVLIFVANWPEKRIEHWDTLLKARAIENQAYVIGVNRIGLDGNGIEHIGNTSIYHPFGNIEYKSQAKETHTHLLSRHDLVLNRRQFPFLKDADGL